MTQEPILNPEANAWSEPVRGLSGRLLVELEDLRPGLRYAVVLELRNHTLRPVTVTDQPQVHTGLFDLAGKPVAEVKFPASGPAREPQWAVIPREATLGFRIDMQTVGVPTGEHGMALLALGGKSWGLRTGEYVLKTKIGFHPKEEAPQTPWSGELDLPPVPIILTPQMLAAGGSREAKP
jgi:hypothetical protein